MGGGGGGGGGLRGLQPPHNFVTVVITPHNFKTQAYITFGS